MTFQVDDFEDAATGTLPGDWSGFTDNDGPTEVSEDGPIEGDKSLLFRDEGGGWTGVRHPVGDETVVFAIDINRDTGLAGDYRQIVLGPRDSGGDFVYQYIFSDDGSGGFDIHFSTSASRQNRQTGDFDATFVGNTAVGFHEMRLDQPQTSLQLVIDGDTVHDSGQSFSGASEFAWETDDMEVRLDRNVEFSTFVYVEGAPVVRGEASQDFVFEDAIGADAELVSDRGDSDFVFIEGQGVGRKT